ncbi:hypothetical protein Plhal304r1_c018g0063531 [Plasmopara halstedii]
MSVLLSNLLSSRNGVANSVHGARPQCNTILDIATDKHRADRMKSIGIVSSTRPLNGATS